MSLSLKTVAAVSADVAATRSRKKKVGLIRECLTACDEHDLQLLVSWLTGTLIQGRIGVGPTLLRDVASEPAAATPTLTVSRVNDVLDQIAATNGPGSLRRRRELLGGVMRAAIHAEQSFLMRLLLGDLRQGALEAVMIDAIAQSSAIDPDKVRRAVMLSGDIAAVAETAITQGEAGLACFRLRIGTPVAVMLAQPADDIEQALSEHGELAFEVKLDGARVQVHHGNGVTRIFTRQLNDVTGSLPEVVERIATIQADSFILDGEVIALRADGRPFPFQHTMRRFGRRRDVARMSQELPLSAFFFDCLQLNGTDLIDLPGRDRLRMLAAALPPALQIPRIVTRDVGEARTFFQHAIEQGHEGVMAKSLDCVYEAGNRGACWLKIKPVHTLDLVVLAAEWGSGRRKGWLSNLHLGARDAVTGEFVMLGKTFKGLTDELLAWQTNSLLQLESHRDGHIVYVRPQLVVEIVFNELQTSPHYPSGLALRFARVKRYRNDKSAIDADTIQTARALHEKRMLR